MEDKLIDLITGILKKDSTDFLWHRDDSLKHHFRMGSPNEEYIECSWEVVANESIGKLVVFKNEHTQLRWSVEPRSELSQLLYYLEQDAIRLTQDQDYLKRLKSRDEVEDMLLQVHLSVCSFFDN